ncbi:MAG TPA: PQQ-binding-like beta-propeller repeat protein [Planctomycetaceae bacterium]|nr:PQQ-binding-like beta-propeller repeat protein [Planctomycetaceae bacterium]
MCDARLKFGCDNRHAAGALRAGVVLVGCLLTSLATCAEPVVTAPTEASWVSFRNGPEQRGVSKSSLPEQLELLWERKTEFGVAGTAAIVGSHVYVPTIDGILFCLNRTDGQEIWSYRSVEDPKTFAPGFKASPLVTEKLVLVGDEDGVLHALDRLTGKKVWSFQSDAEVAGGATPFGDKIVFGSYDSFLYCLNQSDGSLVWKFQTEDRINCAPAIADGHTFVSGCDEHLRIINLDSGKQVADIPLKSFLIASPALWEDQLYVGTYTGLVVAIDWKKRDFTWTFDDPDTEFPFHGSAAVTEKYVLAGSHDKKMHCLDRTSGAEKWSFPTRAQINSSPAIVGDRVFFGSNDGNLYGVNLETGKETFKQLLGRKVTAGPAIGEGVLVVGAEDNRGKIYCFGKK